MVRNFRFITSQQAKAIDSNIRERFGLSTLILMENAGRAVAEEALKVLGRRKAVVLFCGKGNNAGDGFVAARHLLTKGIKPDIFLAGRAPEVKNEAGKNLEILLKLKQNIVELTENNYYLAKNAISRNSLIIDALLGVGLQGEVRGVFRPLIEIINVSKEYVLSVDIPSGLDANTGKVLGCCVRADKTVTFVARKRGMFLGQGPKYCGKVIVADLGIPL
ncbi:MAG: NAD(P)H-hydrate epimerase [Candidatus Omnitrophota bacterium]